MKISLDISNCWPSLWLRFGLTFVLSASAIGNIFGHDDRLIISRFPSYLRAIGSIGNCTAVLVAKDIALTAAHCVIDENQNTKSPSSILFAAGYTRGKSFGTSKVKEIIRQDMSPLAEISADWALLILEKPLGDRVGWMEIFRTDALTQPSELQPNFQLAGYSGDVANGHLLTQHQNCQIRGKDSYMFLHDCDFTSGASGAPLFSFVQDPKTRRLRPTIFALNLGAARLGPESTFRLEDYSDFYGNGAIPMNDIVDKLNELKVSRSLQRPSTTIQSENLVLRH